MRRSVEVPVVAGKSLMKFRLQTCHPENATAAIGQRGGIRAVGQERPFKKLLHSCRSPEPSCLRHTDFSPVHTIIAYADSLPESPLNESISYFEMRCFTIINMRTGGSVE